MKQTLAELVKSRREAKKLSLRQLADLAGVHHTAIQGIEHERNTNPTVTLCIVLGKHLGFTGEEALEACRETWRRAGILHEVNPTVAVLDLLGAALKFDAGTSIDLCKDMWKDREAAGKAVPDRTTKIGFMPRYRAPKAAL